MTALLRVLWALPCSIVGIALALPVLLAGGSARRVDRTLEVALHDERGHAWRLPFAAITFGHVIVGIGHAELAELRRHERVHVRQYERLGPLFLVAYPASSALAWLRGRDPYRDNRYEAQAFREAGDARLA